jgi:hypothetical protein
MARSLRNALARDVGGFVIPNRARETGSIDGVPVVYANDFNDQALENMHLALDAISSAQLNLT